MALQMTDTIKTVVHTNAYHDIRVIVKSDKSMVIANAYKDSAASSDVENVLVSRTFEMSTAHNTTYIGTVHATDNVLKRAQSYLINDEPTGIFSSATEI